jgi:hypothetical protein
MTEERYVTLKDTGDEKQEREKKRRQIADYKFKTL